MTEKKNGHVSLYSSISKTCHRIQNAYLDSAKALGNSEAKAELANLRRLASRASLTQSLLLAEVLQTLDPPLDTKFLGRGELPSNSESAAITAMTMFAIHMQSAVEPAHQAGTKFATACGQLYRRGLSDSIKPRIDAMLLARSEEIRVQHLISLITLMRGNRIGFDYGYLAEDLRSLASSEKKQGVLLRWGRDFAAYRTDNNDKN